MLCLYVQALPLTIGEKGSEGERDTHFKNGGWKGFDDWITQPERNAALNDSYFLVLYNMVTYIWECF